MKGKEAELDLEEEIEIGDEVGFERQGHKGTR